MSWLIWQQHRSAAVVTAVLAGILGVGIVISGSELATVYRQLDVPGCLARNSSDCQDLVDTFGRAVGPFTEAAGWLNLLPLLVGVFIGAPLIGGELERGTYRFVWTQGITRRRWLLSSVGWLTLVTAVGFAGLSAIMIWWNGPIDQTMGRFSNPSSFDLEGLAPVAYAAFGLLLGVSAGTVIGRVLPAAGVVILGFAAVRIGVEGWLRAHFLPPLAVTWDPLQPAPSVLRGSWILEQSFVNASGKPVSPLGICSNPGSALRGEALNQCLHVNGIYNHAVYQPDVRFWPFQLMEATIFLVLAAGLLALTMWWIRSRLS